MLRAAYPVFPAMTYINAVPLTPNSAATFERETVLTESNDAKIGFLAARGKES